LFCGGKRSGTIWENEPVVGYFPRKNELVGTNFDVDKEVEDCARLSEQARQEATDAVQIAKFREQARTRFVEEGRDPDDEDELKSAIFARRKCGFGNARPNSVRNAPNIGAGRIFTLIRNRSPNRLSPSRTTS
jgi:hypothetical protein